ncbi:hypothetical protein [Microcoleus sp. A006_D1]|uniref:hypothetical protein n=1 Tax=Microcoleus sp. A006_D1 TaxID=3055267 RepID=UPI002FD0A24F
MIDKIDFVSAIGAASNAVPAAHALFDFQSCSINQSFSLGSLCDDLILQTTCDRVKGSFASIMGTYTHFRASGDRYVKT